jgi:putative hydrolase of the HAD superfamily|tara:strand:+ start:1704 stop:2345 length:642 start_codon:yes stop_codon:yes gene_type:complete
MIKAVLWDFGGVVTTSPFEAFNRFERANDIPLDFIRTTNATNPNSNAWAKFESNQISLQEFDTLFAEETGARGHEISGSTVVQLLSGELRPQMVTALSRISEKYKTACLTNNMKTGEGPSMQRGSEGAKRTGEVMDMFDVIIQSSVVGVRKPDPKFYLLACEQLEIAPQEAVFMDDLGINLKPARELGMTTIKVIDVAATLSELESILSMKLT